MDAEGFVNLEVLHISQASQEFIQPFIQHLTKLKAIIIDAFLADSIDLLALNREREKLTETRKTSIYIDERAYLNTKWSLNGTDFKMIDVRSNLRHLFEISDSTEIIHLP